MRESSSSEVIVDLFTKGSHHKNLIVILISQNLFHHGRGPRDISLNANYIVVFKNSHDCAQIRHLARQVYPDDPKFPRRGVLRRHIEASRLFIVRFETIDFGQISISNVHFSRRYALCLCDSQIIFQRIRIKETYRRPREPVVQFSRDEGEQ